MRQSNLPGGNTPHRVGIQEALADGTIRQMVLRLYGEAAVGGSPSARANRLKNTREELAEFLAEEGVTSHPSPLAPDGLDLDTHVNAYGLKSFQEGRFELQDAASQIVAELVAPPPRGNIVDACAGAGGKTLALGALLGNKGRLTALDVSEKKLVELRKRARRAGLTNVHASTQVPSLEADRVLVDAPCSGLGVLRRNPEARWR